MLFFILINVFNLLRFKQTLYNLHKNFKLIDLLFQNYKELLSSLNANLLLKRTISILHLLKRIQDTGINYITRNLKYK